MRTLDLGIGLTPDRLTGFSPSLRNPLLWLRADKGVTLNGSTVSAWTDQGTFGRSVAGATGSQPTFVASDAAYNGQPSIQFPNGTFLTAGGAWGAAQPLTYYLALNIPIATNTNIIDSALGGAYNAIQTGGSRLPSLYAGAVSGAANTAIINPCVIACIFNGTTSYIYQNNSTTPTLGPVNAGSSTLDKLQIGAQAGAGATMNGAKIAEIIVTAGSDSQAQRMTMMAYIGVPKGIATS